MTRLVERLRELAETAPDPRPMSAVINEAAALIEELVARLTEARTAIASLDEDALGDGILPDGFTGAAMRYSIRDELLCNIEAALTKAHHTEGPTE